MSDIPNPIGSFEIFAPKKVKSLKRNKANTLKKTSQKVSKKTVWKEICHEDES